MGEFGRLLKTYRRQCRDPQGGQALTQERLAELLSTAAGIEGYSGSTVSNWERGLNRIRRDDRHILTSLVQVLHQAGGMQTLQDANHLLMAGNYRSLDEAEIHQVNPNWKQGSSSRLGDSSFPSAAEQESALPAPTYTQLFGAEDVQEQLLAQIRAPKSPYLLTIIALGGMGKTALADTIARRIIAQNEYDRVIWLSAENLGLGNQESAPDDSLFPTMVNTLYQLLMPEDASVSSAARQLAYVRNELKRHRYLVIFDNLEDPAQTNQLLRQLNTLTGPSKFLVTTRQHPAPDIESYIFPLKELTLPAAVRLLRHQAETGGLVDFNHVSDTELQEIYRLVGGHPLALRLIPRLAHYYPLSEILAGWQEEQGGYIAEVYQTIYATVWQTLQPTERQLLQMMPLVAQSGATTDHLQFGSGLSRASFWPALTRLLELCLLEPRGTWQEQRYGIHSLTARFLEYRQQKESGTSVTVPPSQILANIAYWRQTISQLSEKKWHHLDRERPHILRAIQFSLSLPPEEITQILRDDWIALSEDLFRYIERRGYVREWLPILEQLSLKFPDDAKTSHLFLNRLGEIYRLDRQISRAIEIHSRALLVAQTAEDESAIARTYFNLGTDHFLHKTYERAMAYGQIALDIFARQGLTGRERAAVLNLLGTVTLEQNDLDLSVYYLEEAAAIWRILEQRPELARTLNNLARTRKRQHQYEAALACYAEAKRVLAQSSSELDRILIHLSEGELYFDLGQFAQAETTFKSINLAYLQQSGHLFYLASALNNLGNVTFMQGDTRAAATYLQDSIFLWRQLGDEMELANTLGRWGDVLLRDGNVEEAIAVYSEAENLLENYPQDSRAVHLKRELRLELAKLQQ